MSFQIDSRPIFIGGDGRSGTTLLSVVLDSHPQLSIGSELHFKGPPNLGPYMLEGLKLKRQGDRRLTPRGVRKHPEFGPVLRFSTRAARFGVAQEDLEKLIFQQMKSSGTDLEAFQERCRLIEAMGQYVARRAGKQIWGMKIMREIKGLPRYAKVWPRSRFIHIVRDGRDVAASQVKEHSSWGYAEAGEAARKWSQMMARVAPFLDKHSLLEVRYEDLVRDTRKTLEAIVTFLEIPWDDSLMQHEKAAHALFKEGKTHPSFEAVRQPINDSAVGRYKRDFSPQEIEAFEEAAGDTLRAFGYLEPAPDTTRRATLRVKQAPTGAEEASRSQASEHNGPRTPIFLGGDGRSGTTLLSLMLDSHPEVLGIPELHFQIPDDLGPAVLRVLEFIQSSPAGDKDPKFREDAELIKPFQFVVRCRRAGLEDQALAELIEKAMEKCGSNLSSFADRCVLVDLIADRLLQASGKKVWCLKIMKQIKKLPKFHQCWPSAAFIHLVRDGRDIAASQIDKFSWGYSSAEEAAVKWQDVILKVRSFQEQYPVLEIRYEDLVSRPGAAMKRLLKFLSRKWNARVLRHHEHEHQLLAAGESHASKAEAAGPIHQDAVGRYWSVLSRDDVACFNAKAAQALDLWEYDRLPLVEIDLRLGVGGCLNRRHCRQAAKRVKDRLIPRYITPDHPHKKQVKAAFIDFRGLDYEKYLEMIKAVYRGKRLYNAKLAREEGYYCKPFHRSLFTPDIVEINRSKAVRSGGKMREAYLRPVEKMGGYPKRHYAFEPPQCPLHYDWWWGVFKSLDGHRQGDVVTNEKLVGYVDLRRNGSFAMYNLIIGHGDHLENGIMYLLHLEIVRWLLAREDEHVKDLDYLGYAGFFQGGDGLRRWKKSMGFKPVYMAMRFH